MKQYQSNYVSFLDFPYPEFKIPPLVNTDLECLLSSFISK